MRNHDPKRGTFRRDKSKCDKCKTSAANDDAQTNTKTLTVLAATFELSFADEPAIMETNRSM
jgi:hypothetical protein